MRFTKPAISKLVLPRGKDDLVVFDESLPGFGIRLRSGGKRTWIVQYRIGRQQRRMTLGRADALDLDQARIEAKRALSKVGLAIDPVVEKAKARVEASVTFGALLPVYLSQKSPDGPTAKTVKRLRPRSYAELKRHLEKDFAPLHGLPLAAIDRAMIAARLNELSKRSASAADHARRSASTFFSWAMKEGVVDGNPVLATNRPDESRARDRTLKDGELVEVWAACRDDDYGRIVKLLLLTGQRREEVGALRWSELDLDKCLWSMPGERTKNHRPHDVPLPDAAVAILREASERDGRDLIFGEGDGGFSGWSKAKAALDKRIDAARKEQSPKAKPIDHWTLHDLRRTVATRLGDLGVQPHVVEALLNHVSGPAKAGVAGVYNRSLYAAEKRAALVIWGDHVATLVEGRSSNVVPLKGVR